MFPKLRFGSTGTAWYAPATGVATIEDGAAVGTALVAPPAVVVATADAAADGDGVGALLEGPPPHALANTIATATIAAPVSPQRLTTND
jgi:hypothetical protein